MKAFTKSIKKTDFLKEIKKHREADQILQGTYGKENGKWQGCAEMCLEAVRRGLIIVDTKNGLAWSKRFHNKEIGKCLSARGYKVFTLHLDGQRKQIKLHQLIWVVANGLIPKGMTIDHINRDKLDNRISNLRLADTKLNSNNRRSYTGINNPFAKINLDIANTIRKEYRATKSYRKLAKRFKVSPSLVAQIIRREIWIQN